MPDLLTTPRAHLSAMLCTILLVTLSGCASSGLGKSNINNSIDIDTISANELTAMVCSGNASSESVVTAYLARAKERTQLNAFVSLDETGALAAARSQDAARKAGKPCLPLQGVPLVVKDNIHAAGLSATAGTPALKNFIPIADAPVLLKLREAGAIVLGKTNMHELAFGISGYNSAFNTSSHVGVRNAYDVTKMAGGSSAGSAAALGARISPLALGTDTGGSLRIPCALNGCATLRPTMGRYSQAGIAPISHTRDTAGPMANTMADVELMDRLIAGGSSTIAADLKAVRLGLVDGFLANLDADTKATFDATLVKLKTAGVTILPVFMPTLAELNSNVGFPVALYEAYDDMVAYLAHYATGITINQLAASVVSPDVKGTYDALVIPRKLPTPTGLVDAAPIYKAAISNHRPALMSLYANTFAANKLDGLVFPTVPRTAIKAEPSTSSLDNFGAYIQNTDPSSNAGIPSIQLPIGLGASSKMPIGMEIDGPAGSDKRLLSIGMALEKLLGRIPAAKP